MRITTFVLLLLVAACSGAGRQPEPAPGPGPGPDPVVGEAPPEAPKPKRYRAWCNGENKYLGAWNVDRAVAESLREKHNRLFPHHIVRIDAVE